ncbi:MAG: hypothetical protein JW748_11760 [Anaerolineales bacterium]|nr:hypothetical protein [Anaerolineales bacterium]
MKRPSLLWLLLLLPLVWLAPFLGDPASVHSAPGAEYSDLVVAHWPSAEFIRQSITQFGEIPLWNPHTLGGTPFAADPLSGLYYPPLWLALILPAPLAFNILFFLHLAFAGFGAYFLAREEGAGEVASLLAGIAFGGLPKLVAHAAAGHLTLVLAVSWTPWLLFAARQAACKGSTRRWALAGVMAGIIFLIDPRWVIPSAAAAAGYAIFCGSGMPTRPRGRLLMNWVKHFAVFAVFAAAIAAVLALPMGQFVSLSTRAYLSGADGTVLSLPFSALLGLLFAGIGSSIEWVVYPGVVVLALAFASLLFSPSPKVIWERGSGGEGVGGEEGYRKKGLGNEGEGERGREGWFWFILLLASIFLSLGSNIPGVSNLLDAVPAAGLLRVPPRWMFLAGLALAMLAARGLTRLESLVDGRGIFKKAAFALAAGGLILAATALAMDLPAVLGQDALMWGALGLILFVGFFSRRWNPPVNAALLCLAVIDLAVADGRMIDPNPADPVSADAATVARMISADADAYRVYSPSASIPQLAAVQNGLRSLDGVAPLILASTAETVSRAARVPLDGYSVTLPAFATGNPQSDNREAFPDLQLLGLLNVRYIASACPIQSAMLAGCEQIGGIYLCKSLHFSARVWVAEDPDSWDTSVRGREARIDFESPNQIRLTATGPGIVVLSEVWYPAWRAMVDGKPAEMSAVGGWWRAVAIGPGAHTVEMAYDPILFQIGLAAAALALAAYGVLRRWDA